MRNNPPAVDDLRGFLGLLGERDALCRIATEVDPELEIAAITDRVSKGAGGGRALLFERVRGHDAPVATNLFGSPQRAAWAVGAGHAEEAAGRLARALADTSGGAASARLGRLLQDARFAPRLQPRGPCHQRVMDRPDLRRLPALRCRPGDGGRYLTLPQVVTCHPDGGAVNRGIYRIQLLGPQRAAVHWKPGSDAAGHCRAWHARNLPMPVSVALGGDPALLFAATFPLPRDADEAALAGLLCGRPVAVTPSLHSDLPVPAGAEYVIEGEVRPGETALEGPFGNHTGFYQPAVPVPMLRITSISHRIDPVFPATVVGPPPTENGHLGKLAERLMLPLLQLDHPAILDIHMPVGGLFHGATLISVKPGTRGRSLLQALWQSGPLRRARLLAVACDVDPGDCAAFYWQALNRLDPARDLLVRNGRLGIDATVDPEGLEILRPDEEVESLLQRRWAEYGLD